MRHLTRIATILAVTATAAVAPARAELLAVDLQTAGDGLLTLDTETGLLWLDITVAFGRTYTDVSGQFGPGGDFEGYRHATGAEVNELFQNAGLVVSGAIFSSANFAPAVALQDLIGRSHVNVNGFDVASGFTADHSTGESRLIGIVQIELATSRAAAYFSNTAAGATSYGHYIVIDSDCFTRLAEVDLAARGDKKLTIDPATGLLWLDTTATAGRTCAEVEAQLGPGGEFEGFRYATESEVATLFEHACLTNIGSNIDRLSNTAPAIHLQSLVGVTLPNFFATDLTLGFTADIVSESSRRVAVVRTNRNSRWGSAYFGVDSTDTTLFGHWLVLEQASCATDLNADGQTSSADLALILGAWGTCP